MNGDLRVSPDAESLATTVATAFVERLAAALRDAPDVPSSLAARIYDVPPELLPAAARNVLAHLIALCDLGAVRAEGAQLSTAIWHAA